MTDDTPMLTPRMQHTMSRAGELARSMGHNNLGTEHMILALIEDSDGIAGLVMKRVGCANAVRAEVIRIVETVGYSRPSGPPARPSPG